MTSIERVNCVLKGEIPDRVPVCLINFISVCREAGFTINECFKDSRKFANAHIIAQKKYGHDMVHLQNGVVGLAQSLGCKVEYYDTICPEVVERPYKDYKDFIENYNGFIPKELLVSLIEATKQIVKEIGENVFIRADSEIGPFALAGTIFGFEKFLMDILDEDKRFELNKVLNICCEVIIELGKELKKAGAHLTGIGDPLAGPDVVSPQMYIEMCYKYHKYIFSKLKRYGIDSYLHCCGDATKIIEYMVDTGAIALELDYKIDSKKCRKATLGKCTLIGTIDPSDVMCHGNPELVMEKAREAIDIFGKKGWYILGPGCDLPYETPEDNIFALVEAAKMYGEYPF
jgi:uroporphyrinogen decarboxylase